MSIPAAARVLLAALFALAGTVAAGTQGHPVLGAGCTVMIPRSVDRVDAARKEFRGIGPGSVVCLPAGERGNIKLFNLRGTAEQPIVVRNSGGPVTITGTEFGDGGIIIAASSFLRLTGTGTNKDCGADHSPRAQRCGSSSTGPRRASRW